MIIKRILIAFICLLLFKPEARSQTARKISDYGESDLKVEAKLDKAGVTITNKESFVLKNCKINLNGSVITSGFTYYPQEIKSGKSITIKLTDFKSDEGKSIVSEDETPFKISVSCGPDKKESKVFIGKFQ